MFVVVVVGCFFVVVGWFVCFGFLFFVLLLLLVLSVLGIFGNVWRHFKDLIGCHNWSGGLSIQAEVTAK